MEKMKIDLRTVFNNINTLEASHLTPETFDLWFNLTTWYKN